MNEFIHSNALSFHAFSLNSARFKPTNPLSTMTSSRSETVPGTVTYRSLTEEMSELGIDDREEARCSFGSCSLEYFRACKSGEKWAKNGSKVPK